MVCDDFVESCCEKGLGVLIVGDVYFLVCFLNKMKNDFILVFVQEFIVMFFCVDVQLVIQEEDIQ